MSVSELIKSEKTTIHYSIKSIRVISQEVNQVENYRQENLNLNFGLKFQIDTKKNQFGVFTLCSFDHKSPNDGTLQKLVSVEVETTFFVQDLSKFEEKTGNITLSTDFVITFVSIAIGAARGILATILNPTPYSNLIIPPFSIDAIKGMVEAIEKSTPPKN